MPTNSALPIRRALISVSEKSGLEALAPFLHGAGVEILSTGGTARFIDELGISVTLVEDVTGFPEIMDGRVKTLHPKIHGALLGRRDVPEHVDAMGEQGITPIDLLVVNLYPFEKTVADPGVSLEDAIENIDIGGPAMIRAAAKNHEHVGVVTDPRQYEGLLAELRATGNTISLETRRRLAADAFARTAAYDSAITNFLASRSEFRPAAGPEEDQDAPASPLPARIALPLLKIRDLRYGENPHQAAALYRLDEPEPHAIEYGALATARQLHGKPLSYNNLLDANGALALARDMHALEPGAASAVVVKHTNPCGAAVGPDARSAIEGALAGDPLAAYGGILATSATLDGTAAERLTDKSIFLEVIIAAAFTEDALSALTARSKNVRLLRAAPEPPRHRGDGMRDCTIRSIDGGFLAQTRDDDIPDSGAWTLHAGAPADDATLRAARIVWAIAKHLSSNAIAIGGRGGSGSGVRLFGAGAGQMDRVASCRIAVVKAGDLARGAIAASDAFFPFPDGPEVLIGAGVRTIVHPGGSKRDAETFALCRERGVACYTTGKRHFRH